MQIKKNTTKKCIIGGKMKETGAEIIEANGFGPQGIFFVFLHAKFNLNG